MRVGIYGGSFDPVHYGHVNVARTAVADLALDLLLVVPAAVSPFKTGAEPGSGPWRRLDMVKAAFADVPNAVVDMREVERGGVSYAIDTVRSVAAAPIPNCHQRAARAPAQRHAPLLAALAHNGEPALINVNVVPLQPGKLRYAQPAAV